MLTVKKLIEALKEMPEDALVYGYSDLDEGDFPVVNVQLVKGPTIIKDEEGDKYKVTPFYCKGNSYIEELWEEFGEQPIVVLK